MKTSKTSCYCRERKNEFIVFEKKCKAVTYIIIFMKDT